MVVGYGIQDLVVEVVSATQIRFGFFLAQLDKEVTSIEIVGLSITEDTGASLTYSASVNGVDATQTAITNGMQFTYINAVDTDVDGLFEVTATLSSPFTSSLTVEFTSLKVNGEYTSPLGANMVLEVPDNAPTVVTQIADASIDEDSAYSYDTSGHFTDVDVADDLTFSISGAPSTLTIDADSGIINGIPLDADVGVHSIQVTATDQTSNSVTIDYDLTVVDVNNAPTGVPTVTGVTTVGKVLTVDEDPIDDADGIIGATPTFEWYRTDTAGTKTKIDGASSNTYTLVNADVGSTISSTVKFMDDEGAAEAVSSVESAVIADVVKVLEIKNTSILTAAEASVEINGTDYTGGSTDRVMKFELYLDATNLAQLNYSSAVAPSEILGVQMDLDLDDLILDSVTGFASSSDSAGWKMEVVMEPGYTDTSNPVLGKVIVASDSAIVDTDTSNDTGRDAILAEVKLATIYINPKDSLQSFDLGISNIQLSVNGGETVLADAFDVNFKTGAIANINNTDGNELNAVGLEFIDSSGSESQSLAVTNGEISIESDFSFDSIELVDTSIYTSGVNISDAVSVLRHIAELESLGVSGFSYHAADVNDDGLVNISDAVAILRHIAELEQLDTFNLIDSLGQKVTILDSTMSTSPDWTLIENGDVNSSGVFDNSVIINTDLI